MTSVCAFPDCGRPRHNRNRLCGGHRIQRRKKRELAPLRPQTRRLAGGESHAERFADLASPEPNTGCWIWTGGYRTNGYGQYAMPGSGGYAHRASLVLHVGPPPKGKQALHSCDNRWCVNPSHLRWGTQRENNADARARGRARTAPLQGEAAPTSKLTVAKVAEIRTLIAQRVSDAELARRFGVSAPSIRLIRVGKSWRSA